jgi:hypothetical protein
MPAKTEGMPKMLAAHVHALLVQTGMTKTAKKFEGEFGGEVRRERGALTCECALAHMAGGPAVREVPVHAGR